MVETDYNACKECSRPIFLAVSQPDVLSWKHWNPRIDLDHPAQEAPGNPTGWR